MRPIVLIKGKDGNVNMTIEEFKKHLDDAYDAGVQDGRKDRCNYWPQWTYYTTPTTDKITISCNDILANNDITV